MFICIKLAAKPVLSELMSPHEFERVAKKIKAIEPNWRVLAVEESAMAGFYRIDINDGRVVYYAKASDHFFIGELYENRTEKIVNLTAEKAKQKRARLLLDIDLATTIVYPAIGDTKATVYIFLDVDCSACRKLHRQTSIMPKLGVEVRYLAYPRAGIDSTTYLKMSSAWCAKDRKAALSRLVVSNSYQEQTCESNPVSDHYQLGQRMGVAGTPAIALLDGTLIHGFQTAQNLADTLVND